MKLASEGKKLGFGLMRLPILDSEDQKSIDFEQLELMVDTFLERGFTYFDTAYMYHDYESEIALREALVKRHPRDSFTVATKLPTMFLKKVEDMERIFNEQLEKTGVTYFDYYLLHNLDVARFATAEKLGAFDFVLEKKAEGKAKQVGFSFHDSAALLDEILTAHPEMDFVQLQLNYADWENESIQSRKCYEVAEKHGKPVIVMEPIKGGTLAELPARAGQLFKEYRPEASEASWAIRFAASHDNVMMVLSGMSNQTQLLDNTGYMSDFEPLNAEEHKRIGQAVSIIREEIAVPCTACQYCVEGCPMGIQIPKVFALYNAEKQAKAQAFSVHKMYYNNLTKTSAKASACINCRKCEKSCPQHIEITKFLEDVVQTFEV